MSPNRPASYQPRNKLRIVTAASLFDGHDAAINIMRRIIQGSGAEVIHLGHNRSVQEIVDCALQEDAHAVAITSYQGGHVEYFKYMVELIRQSGQRIEIFGGGGGTILPTEIDELHAAGVTRLYSPDDGRSLGLQGMIDDLLERCDFEKRPAEVEETLWERFAAGDRIALAHLITVAENHPTARDAVMDRARQLLGERKVPVLGITGTGGAGKSSLVDELVQRFLRDPREGDDRRIAVISVDPTRRRSGGALLGDRIRMNSVGDDRVFMRSLATRGANLSLSANVQDAVELCKAAGYDLVVLESSGIGQSDTRIIDHCDVSLYVMTSEYGAATQLEKIDMLDFADIVAINKFDKRGADDALRDVRKQVRRNRNAWETPAEQLPVFGTIASQFADPGVTALYVRLMAAITERTGAPLASALEAGDGRTGKASIIPAERSRYLADICHTLDNYDDFVQEQGGIARRLFQLQGAISAVRGDAQPAAQSPASPLETRPEDDDVVHDLVRRYNALRERLHVDCRALLTEWPELVARYSADTYRFTVRGRELSQPLVRTSLSGTPVRRVSLPRLSDWGDLLQWRMHENLPGFFPYAAGVFPLKRVGEDPARMFAGEGGPERTNKRFHYVSQGLPAKRLSTAFDSVTLYGEDPDHRPDIYGKVGNSGVSVCTVDDAKKLYSGFDLCAPTTSVSMTINGPAPIVLALFLNAAVDQQCERYIDENGLWDDVEAKIQARYGGAPRPAYQGDLPEGSDGLGTRLLGVSGDEVLPAEVYEQIRAATLRKVRGTVQADILKEDQAQNTCIFSTEFALRMQGDIQRYFVDHTVRNFYSVSISGYHIAEAGANPITQLAFTLANGFTFVEYYLSRGMHIDDFAPNLSFFFSNGMDPEYSVIGRVARRIWAKAIKLRYGGNARSQKLKYHIQTSGRSLHAQEIAFNDIRTTLQALYAIYDNCNSLHTNAYDEAITTPTEESVRRALAIQLIINKELGQAKNENPLQGSFIIDELTELVEQAVLTEFRRLSERGGVLGAMERMYQRSKIQEESLHYESQKHTGELPIIGVNTFLSDDGSPTIIPDEVIRATEAEKQYAIASRKAFQQRNADRRTEALKQLQQVALEGGNIFAELMETVKSCTLGDITGALYDVGGRYRRNM
jgi:methylmalonyl-CoA mutase